MHGAEEPNIQLECAALPPKIDPQKDKRTNVRVELPRDLRLRGPATVLLTNATAEFERPHGPDLDDRRRRLRREL